MPEWTRLITVEGDIEKTQVESLLRSEHIDCVMQELDNSEFIRVYMGSTHARSDVLVKEGELERARELLKAFEYELKE